MASGLKSVVTTAARISYDAKFQRVEMDESEFFSDSILDFVRDEDEFEEIDRLFEQIPDEVFAAIWIALAVTSEELSPTPQLVANSSA